MSYYIKKSVFLPPISQAEVAQLVEHNLAKVGVASSSLVFRSFIETFPETSLFFFKRISLLPCRDAINRVSTNEPHISSCIPALPCEESSDTDTFPKPLSAAQTIWEQLRCSPRICLWSAGS